MRNKKSQHCWKCGILVEPGKGNLVYVGEEEEMLGFGPMGCTGWFVSCLDIEACNKRKKAREEARKAENARLQAIREEERRLFKIEDGEYIREENQMRLEGIKYAEEGKEQDIYGGGTWYIVQNDYIWKVKNNGGDYDDWSQNNIYTGGAGAIGYRYPKTEERISWIEANCVNLTEKARKEAEEEKARKEAENARIRTGLEAMLKRITWEELEKTLAERNQKYFCPRELTENGHPTANLTIAEAKKILGL